MSGIAQLFADSVLRRVSFAPLENARISTFKTGEQLNRSTLAPTGLFPVMNGGTSPSGFHDQANTSGPAITISQGGASAGFVSWMAGSFWAGAHCYVVTAGSEMDHRFLYHCLKWQEPQIQGAARGAGIPGLGRKPLGSIRLPVPPLQVQREIAKTLDTFTELEAKLEVELEARRLQYAHYRHRLLAMGDRLDALRAPLSELAEFRRGTAITEKQTSPGSIPVVANGPISAYSHAVSNRAGGTLVIARSGAYAGFVSYWAEPIFLTDAFSIHPDESVLAPKYLFYLLQSQQDSLHGMKQGAGVPHVRVREVEARVVAVPPMEEQLRIVETLGAFDSLVNDLSIGLPAELAARRKQYEYYRDKLLTFEEAPA